MPRKRDAVPPADTASVDTPPTARIATRRSAAGPVLALPAGYADLLETIRRDVRTSQVRAALAANRELIALYWRIGRAIVERQAGDTWGSAVLERLAADLRRTFPGVAGFSRTNLFRIRAFYLAWSGPAEIVPQPVGHFGAAGDAAANASLAAVVPQAVGQLPWGHNVALVEQLKDPAARRWYTEAATQHGWSRSVLERQIAGRLHERQGQAVTNFATALPAPESDLARQALKDPYVFDFLTLHADAGEREVEGGLVGHLEKFLLELGAGFAFVGRQVHLEVDGEDYYVDLLFYHLRLRCFVVVELKDGPFKPEYTGKLNFYLSAVDDLMRHPDDRPSIGLLLCRTKRRTTVEYALRDVQKPIGVAEFETRLVASLPDDLKGSLPTVEELERELGGGDA
jgi:predicted nuclease of restriction endonuclease-like (RecB) superfamily